MNRPNENCRRTFRGDGPWLGLAVAALVLAAIGIWQTPLRINHDCALYLQAAELLLDGAMPYRDFVDTNPPLVIYLSVPVAALARLIGASPIPVFQGLMTLLLAITGVELYALLRQSRFRAGQRGVVLLAWVAAFMVVDWRNEIGQREHLFILLYLPYLFLRVGRCRVGGTVGWFAVVLGIQAGLGVSLKPHFLAVALVVEAVLLASSRRWRELIRPECIAATCVVAAYMAHWLFVPAAMREAFFGRWLPMIYHGYGVYNVSLPETLQTISHAPIALAGLVAAVGGAWLIVCRRTRLHDHLLALSTMTGLGCLLTIVQRKGWDYHRIPLETAGLLCCALLVIAVARMLPQQPNLRGRYAPTAAFIVGCLFLVFLGVSRLFGWNASADSEPQSFAVLREIVELHTEPGDRVLFAATSVRPAFPMLLQMNRKPGSRYLCCFPIAIFYGGRASADTVSPYRRYDDAPVEERQFLDELAADVDNLRPQLIVIQNSAGWLALPGRFNTFDYLTQSGWTHRTLTGYHEIPGPEGWKVFATGEKHAD